MEKVDYMTDTPGEKMRQLANDIRWISMLRPIGYGDRYGQVASLLKHTANVFDDIERDVRVMKGRCAECWHVEGEHVNDKDFTEQITYECQVKHCSCPAFVRQEPKQ